VEQIIRTCHQRVSNEAMAHDQPENRRNSRQNLVARCCSRYRQGLRYPAASIVAFCATCSVQHESGCRVMSPNDTRRLPTSMKNTADLDEEQNVVRDEPSPGQHFDREKVCAGEHVHVRPDELFPGGRATPLRRWRDLVSVQDVADGLV